MPDKSIHSSISPAFWSSEIQSIKTDEQEPKKFKPINVPLPVYIGGQERNDSLEDLFGERGIVLKLARF